MTINFEKYADTGRAFVNKIAFELGDDDNTARAGRVLRSTLHVLRDQSTPEECVQLISQLPMARPAQDVASLFPSKLLTLLRYDSQF